MTTCLFSPAGESFIPSPAGTMVSIQGIRDTVVAHEKRSTATTAGQITRSGRLHCETELPPAFNRAAGPLRTRHPTTRIPRVKKLVRRCYY